MNKMKNIKYRKQSFSDYPISICTNRVCRFSPRGPPRAIGAAIQEALAPIWETPGRSQTGTCYHHLQRNFHSKVDKVLSAAHRLGGPPCTIRTVMNGSHYENFRWSFSVLLLFVLIILWRDREPVRVDCMALFESVLSWWPCRSLHSLWCSRRF